MPVGIEIPGNQKLLPLGLDEFERPMSTGAAKLSSCESMPVVYLPLLLLLLLLLLLSTTTPTTESVDPPALGTVELLQLPRNSIARISAVPRI